MVCLNNIFLHDKRIRYNTNVLQKNKFVYFKLTFRTKYFLL